MYCCRSVHHILVGAGRHHQPHQSNKEYMEMFTKGTHFNPVDLVCAVKNYKGEASM